MIVYTIIAVIVIAIFRALHLVKVVGRENVPTDRGYMVCANHSSLSDPIYLVTAVGIKPKVRFMAKKEIFKNKLLGALFRYLGAFPVDRKGADVSAIKEALKTVRAGGRLAIFPQGTRHSVDGDVKAGAGMLALRTGCDVLPIYIPEKKWRFGRLKIVIGKPFRPTPAEGKPTQEDYHRAAEEIFEKISELAGK